MSELNKDYFPTQCRGCYECCYKCNRTIRGMRVADIREMAASRMVKLQALSRMQRDVTNIETQLSGFFREEEAGTVV